MDVGRPDSHGQRDAVRIDHRMTLRARSAAIRQIRPGRFAPLEAGAVAESNDARDQSILSASPRRSSSAWWRRFQTPTCCQPRSLRQQVMPPSQAISLGSFFQGRPVISTNKMPVSTCRSRRGNRPLLGLGLRGGRSGWITAHSSSETISVVVVHPLLGSRYTSPREVLC